MNNAPFLRHTSRLWRNPMLRHLLAGSSLLVLATAAHVGTASASHIFDLSTGSISFGNVLVGQSSSRDVTVTSRVGQTMNLTYNNPDSPFSGDTSNVSLKSGKSTTDTITFAPTVRGNASDSVGVSGKAGSATQTGSVALRGKGVPRWQVAPASSPNMSWWGRPGPPR